MDLLGGKIGFRSVEGEGSVFWIELDLLPAQEDNRAVSSLSVA